MTYCIKIEMPIRTHIVDEYKRLQTRRCCTNNNRRFFERRCWCDAINVFIIHTQIDRKQWRAFRLVETTRDSCSWTEHEKFSGLPHRLVPFSIRTTAAVVPFHIWLCSFWFSLSRCLFHFALSSLLCKYSAFTQSLIIEHCLIWIRRKNIPTHWLAALEHYEFQLAFSAACDTH